jgi:predicted component of type VI protein secretion system
MPSSSRVPPQPPASAPTRVELQQSLERLHAELSSSSQVDARSRALLHAVLDDIRRLLASGRNKPAERALETAPRRLAELAVEFEARHPALTGSVRQFVDLLGRAGL